MRRLLFYIFSYFLLGITIYHTSNYLMLSAALAALFYLLIINKQKKLCIFCIIFLLLGTASAFINIHNLTSKYSYLIKQSNFEGYILSCEKDKYLVKNYRSNYKIILYYNSKDRLKAGEYISFKGKANILQSTKINSFFSRGVITNVNGYEGSIKSLSKKGIIMLPIKLRDKINTTLSTFKSPGAGFICGLVSGYTGEIDFNTLSSFKELNLSHILAVSGFNLGIIYLFFIKIAHKWPHKIKYISILLLLFFYTAFAGFEPSITRAFIMILIAILSKLIKRIYDVLNGIIITAFIMLLINSYNIYNLGFILSFTATIGIVVLKNDIEDRLPNYITKLRTEIAVSLGVFMITLPIVLYHQGSISILSIFINILIAPLISFITILSFICSIIYIFLQISLIFLPCVLLGDVCVYVINLLKNFALNVTLGSPSLFFIFLYYIYLLMVFNYIKVHKKYLLQIATPIILVIFIINITFKSNNLKIHILNVGQGDSILMELPGNSTILLDTGPEVNNYIALRDKVIPYLKKLGYRKLDMVILSHNHRDHAGGLNYLIKNEITEMLMVYEKPEGIEYNCTYLSQGDVIKSGKLTLKILEPEEDGSFSEANEASLIIELVYGSFSMLFTGDAPSEELSELSGKYDVFKIPHHGSINSLNIDFLKRSTIANAIISVGKNNFGHPSKKVIEAMADLDIKVYRTDIMGDIIIETDGSSYKIFHNSSK